MNRDYAVANGTHINSGTWSYYQRIAAG